jgi:tartrate-resistant acid phosphatase type 5
MRAMAWVRLGSAVCFAVSAWSCGSADDANLGTGGAGGSGGTSGAGGVVTDASLGGGSGAGGASGAGGEGGEGGVGGTGGAQSGVRFVAIGDCGKGDAGQLAVAAAVQAKCAQSGCDFVQLLGDNIYNSGVDSVDDPQWWTKFEQPYANITVPFWVVLGNHDYGGGGTGFESWRADVQVAYSQKSNKWRLPAKYYGHQEPGVDFFGLDTNAAMFDSHQQQKQELAQWLDGSTAPWKIAFGHHPYRSNGPHGNAGSYENLPLVPIVNGAGVKDLMEAAVCGKADVYIGAHDHSLQWLEESCDGTELLISGGGSSHTDLPGKNSTHYQAAKTGYLYVIVGDKTFTGEFYDSTGQLEFTRTITKP